MKDGIYPYRGHYIAVKNGVIISHEDTKAEAWEAYYAEED